MGLRVFVLCRNDGLNVSGDSVLSERQLMAVECGLEFAALDVLTPRDEQAVVGCYFESVRSNRRWPIRQGGDGAAPAVTDHESVGAVVEEGRRRLPSVQFGPTGDVRLLHRVDWCTLPGLGNLTVTTTGDGTRQFLGML